MLHQEPHLKGILASILNPVGHATSSHHSLNKKNSKAPFSLVPDSNELKGLFPQKQKLGYLREQSSICVCYIKLSLIGPSTMRASSAAPVQSIMWQLRLEQSWYDCLNTLQKLCNFMIKHLIGKS